jgi:hypothetical protein
VDLPNPDFSKMTGEELAAYQSLWELTTRTHAEKLSRLEDAATKGREAVESLPRVRTLHTHATRQLSRLREEMKRRA